jgi:hypothetical protein
MLPFKILLGIAVLYFLIMTPIQYRYIAALKEKQKKSKLKQHEMYEKMLFEEEQLHFHNQGNLWNWPSFIAASIIYKIKHRQK